MNAYCSNYDKVISISIDNTELGYSIIDDFLHILAERANEELNADNIEDAIEVIDLAVNLKVALAERKKKDMNLAARMAEEVANE